jgi:hypothetical protein
MDEVYSMQSSQELSNSSQNEKHITILGDSTIDNKLWIFPGLTGNYLYDRLGIKRENTATRIKKSHDTFWKTELSIIEHLTDILPNYTIHDYSNDGFTTGDCLHGAYKDWVFGEKKFSLFPHEYFLPLESSAQDIRKSQYVILSVGGNDLREFLVRLSMIEDEDARKKEIKDQFDIVLKNLHNQYLEIFQSIRNLNSDAIIILATQYYPSVKQNHYQIYSLILEIGKTLNLGVNPNDPMDIIHEIMKETYRSIINSIPKEKVVIVDITSSLNPFDNENHAHQIEPSNVGGKKIARMLKHIITQSDSGCAYKFSAPFFEKQDSNAVVNTPFSSWVLNHPYDFININCRKLLCELYEIQNNYSPSDPMHQICKQISAESKILLTKLDDTNIVKNIEIPLAMAINILTEQPNEQSQLKLTTYLATHSATFFPSPQKTLNKLLAALCKNIQIHSPTPQSAKI